MLVNPLNKNCISNKPSLCEERSFISRPKDHLYSINNEVIKGRICFFDTLFSKLLHLLSLIFKRPEKAIDPKLFAYWDRVVQKDYDPENDPNPAYTFETNAAKRGKTLADGLIRAIVKAKNEHSRFDTILVLTQGRGILFSADGDYLRLASRAKVGEFNSGRTLILLAIPQIYQKEEQIHIRQIIDGRKRDGFNIEHASFFSLNSKEIKSLQREILPKRLAQVL